VNTNTFINSFRALHTNEQADFLKNYENGQNLSVPEIHSLSATLLRLPRKLLDQANISQDIRSLDLPKRAKAITHFFEFLAQDAPTNAFLSSIKSSLVFLELFQQLSPLDQRIISSYIVKNELSPQEAKILALALSRLSVRIYAISEEPLQPALEESSHSPMDAGTCVSVPLDEREKNARVISRFKTFLQSPHGELTKKLIDEVGRREFRFSPRQMLLPTNKEWQSACDALKEEASKDSNLANFLSRITRLLTECNAIPKFEWNDRIEKLQWLKHLIDSFLSGQPLPPSLALHPLVELSKKIGNKIQYIVEINRRALLIQKEYYPIDIQIENFSDSTPMTILDALREYQNLSNERKTCPHSGALYDLDRKRLMALKKLNALVENKTLKDKKNQKIFLPELVKEKINYLEYLQAQGRAELNYSGLSSKEVQKHRLQFLRAMVNLQKGGRPLSQGYWLEKNDPLHRFWSGAQLANSIVAEWKNKSSFTSFFTYLETVEHKEQIANAVDESRVTYFDAEGRKELRLDFVVDQDHQTRLVRNGQLADTSDGTTVISGQGYNIFVVDNHGEMYIGPQILGRRHHSGFMAGENVRSGGEIVIKEGRVVKIKHGSGHYLTEHRHIFRALQLLNKKGVDLKGIELSMPQKTGDGNIITTKTGHKMETIVYAVYDAYDYLTTRGHCLAKSSTTGWSAAHEAAWNGKHPSLAKELKALPEHEQLAFVNAQDSAGNSPLHLTVKNRLHFMLTPTSPKQNESSEVEYTSSWEEHQKCAQALLQAGAKINATNQAGSTPLHDAIRAGNKKAVQFLLANPTARIDIPDQSRMTALSLAAKEASAEILELLLNDPRSSQYVNTQEIAMQLLHAAISGSSLEKTQLLFERLEQQKLLPEDKNALLFTFVAKCQNPKVLHYLLSKGLNIDAQDTRGRTPLHLATILSEPLLIRELVRQNASLELQDLQGQTALHLAVMYAKTSPQIPIPYIRMKTIQTLLEIGADLFIVNQANQNPLDTTINGTDVSLQSLVENQKEGFGDLLPVVNARGINWAQKERRRVTPQTLAENE